MGAAAVSGRRRGQLITAGTASVLRIRDFLSVAWPTVTETCAQPFVSVTWLAALQVVTGRCGGDPARLAVMGLEEFTGQVRSAVPGWGGQRPCRAICGRIFAALTDTEGAVLWCRRGLLRRVADELGDLARTRAQLRAVEADMVACWPSSAFPGWRASRGLARSARRRSWPRPATRTGITARLRWSSTPGWLRPRTPRAASPGSRVSPAAAGRPAADRVARGLADAPVQPRARRQVPGDGQHRRRRPAGTAPERGRAARRPPGPARGAPRPGSRAPPRCCAGSTP